MISSVIKIVPPSWKVVQFGEILENGTRNGIYKTKEFHGSGAKIVNMGELFAYPRLFSVEMKRVRLTEREKEGFLLKQGDLLFARRSLVAEGAGRCSVVCEVTEPTTFESSIIRARPNKKVADSLFLYYLYKSSIGRYLIGTLLREMAVSGITGKDLVNLEIPLPPIEEQKAIAKILSSLDDKIELNRQMNATLEAMARAVFKAWFVDFEPVRANSENRPSESASPEIAKLFPSEFENDIPKGWRNGNLRDCCLRVESGGTPSRKVESYWTNGTIAWLTSGEVRKPIVLDTKEYISVEGYENSNAKLWKKGTTVVAMYGATAGEVCLLANEMTANQACCGLIPKENHRAFLFTKTFQSKQELASKSSGSAQQNLNQSIVANFQILLPDEYCIKAFEQATGRLFDKWIENEKENLKLAEIRDSLLPRLISGKIRVGEAESEIAQSV